MIIVYVPCSSCRGSGRVAFEIMESGRCPRCDGLGRQWAAGAPSYGCSVTLADRYPGEIVTLGTGHRAKILWHMPRKKPKQRPEATFVDLLEEFTDAETYKAVGYPSCVGVSEVIMSRVAEAGAHVRGDEGDPLQRHGGVLI